MKSTKNCAVVVYSTLPGSEVPMAQISKFEGDVEGGKVRMSWSW